jgi:hypothetical protein
VYIPRLKEAIQGNITSHSLGSGQRGERAKESDEKSKKKREKKEEGGRETEQRVGG